jgi:hypothetical protein
VRGCKEGYFQRVISGKPGCLALQILQPFLQILHLCFQLLTVGIFSIILLGIAKEDPELKVLSLNTPDFLLIVLEILHLLYIIIKPHGHGKLLVLESLLSARLAMQILN